MTTLVQLFTSQMNYWTKVVIIHQRKRKKTADNRDNSSETEPAGTRWTDVRTCRCAIGRLAGNLRAEHYGGATADGFVLALAMTTTLPLRDVKDHLSQWLPR